jgi:hypothetical protein
LTNHTKNQTISGGYEPDVPTRTGRDDAENFQEDPDGLARVLCDLVRDEDPEAMMLGNPSLGEVVRYDGRIDFNRVARRLNGLFLEWERGLRERRYKLEHDGF